MAEAFKSLSYLGIFLALCIEFVPAEIVLPLAGYWVYQGDMSMFGVVAAGSLGGVAGPLTLYWLGRYGGGRFGTLRQILLYQAWSAWKIGQVFEKHGGFVAFSGRFIPGIRTLISIPCGLAKMNVWVFCIYTFLAITPITFVYVYLGFTSAKTGARSAAYWTDTFFRSASGSSFCSFFTFGWRAGGTKSNRKAFQPL